MKVSYLSVLIKALEMQTRFADPEVGLHVFANSAWSVVYGCGVSPPFSLAHETSPNKPNNTARN